jgi:8-oxo-dGTP pyrophosphatase MutT (NUDIX family)
LNLKDWEYYMIPWWWIEEWESPTQALKREIKEEVWVNIKNIIPLWYIEEKRGVVVMKDIWDKFWKYLKSFWFIAEVEGKKWEQQLEEDELKEKMKVERLDFEKVENILKNYSVNNNIWKFVKKRDLRFLEEAKKYIK